MARLVEDRELCKLTALAQEGNDLDAVKGFLVDLAELKGEWQPSGNDRRVKQRYQYVETITLMPIDPATKLPILGSSCTALARNISNRGICFVGRGFMDCAELVIELTMPDGRAALFRSRIVRVQPFRRNLYEVGAEFIERLGTPPLTA